MTTLDASSIATPRVAAGALFFDENRRILLAKPAYKAGWDIPGGYVEPGESPHAACVREVREELGITSTIGRLLVVDWAPIKDEGDKILFVFDAGLLSASDHACIKFPDGEITDVRFVASEKFDEYLPSRLTRRLRTAIDAKNSNTAAYAEHGDKLSPFYW